MSQLHAVRGCVPDNDHSPSNLSGVAHRAAFNQMRNDIGRKLVRTRTSVGLATRQWRF